ncbi:MAG TPA: sigma 54-interacting transcriptional regulator, partial [Dyadobacter sp.]|nr:sigma 54-interacting transcriptional regulator [Dyadobacter sp.]
AEEERKGNSAGYILFFKKMGLKHVYASALRVGQKNLGTMFFLSDDLNLNLLKGLCAQISIAISNICANEKILAYKQLLEIENDQLKEEIRTIYNFNEIVGSGPEMQEVYHLMSLVASSSSTVLLLGETGTGKELIARAIHNASPRKDKLMIKVNCAALPASLIESELFGHEKGAFTGAVERRIGKFELADKSTLFLDEIGEMPLEAQVKLLRVLQEKELERIGGKTTVKVDVRIIAATNRNLEEEVRAGRFRSDLYYRLNVFPIVLPPLRNRRDDIAPLAHFFMDRYSKNAGRKITRISPEIIRELIAYSWPGNVRELEHVIERTVLLTNDGIVRRIHLPKEPAAEKEAAAPLTGTLSEMERAYIIEVLRRFEGKISGLGGAAEFLDVPATTLHSKMKKLKISKSDYY